MFYRVISLGRIDCHHYPVSPGEFSRTRHDQGWSRCLGCRHTVLPGWGRCWQGNTLRGWSYLRSPLLKPHSLLEHVAWGKTERDASARDLCGIESDPTIDGTVGEPAFEAIHDGLGAKELAVGGGV